MADLIEVVGDSIFKTPTPREEGATQRLWNAGFACKRKQSLHSGGNNRVQVIMACPGAETRWILQLSRQHL